MVPPNLMPMANQHRLDRATTRRVLRRASAAEVERVAGAASDGPDPFDTIDVETVVAAAVDAGIAEAEVRRAIAIERLGDAPRARRGDALLGPAEVAVDAELAGTPGELLARLDGWLVNGHHMRRDRLRGGRGVWSRRQGPFGTLLRSARKAIGEGHLGELERIEAAAADTGAGTSAVRVVADRRRDRLQRAAGSALTGVGGTALVATAAATGELLVLLATPLPIGLAAIIAGTGRRAARQVAGEVERVLDAVEQGDQASGLGADIVRRVIGRGARVTPLPRPFARRPPAQPFTAPTPPGATSAAPAATPASAQAPTPAPGRPAAPPEGSTSPPRPST